MCRVFTFAFAAAVTLFHLSISAFSFSFLSSSSAASSPLLSLASRVSSPRGAIPIPLSLPSSSPMASSNPLSSVKSTPCAFPIASPINPRHTGGIPTSPNTSGTTERDVPPLISTTALTSAWAFALAWPPCMTLTTSEVHCK